MSAATDVIGAMRNSGFVLELDGDRLKVRVPPGCPTFYKDLLRSRKSEFIAALKELEQDRPDAQPPAGLTDDERCALVSMGLRWGYTAEDWGRLWNDCQDPEQRANWLRIAESERPPETDVDDLESSIVIRIEGSFGSGRMQFDLQVPVHRWDEAEFSEQVSRLTDARWWRLDQPKRCTDCRHARPTSHPALAHCDQRDDPPACGYWWQTDLKMCSLWAPTASTDIKIQEQRT